jgi:N4-gp56 family major capsid protein
MLSRALPHLVHTWFGQVRDVPTNNTNVIKFRRYNALTVSTTALTAGVTPSTASMTVTDVTATLAQYGNVIEASDELLLTTEDPYTTEVMELLGENAGQTLDQVAREVLVAGTSVQYASTASSRGTVTSTMKLTAAEIREAVRTLKTNNAKKITSMINPSTGIDTIPVNSAFVAVVHPNTVYDLKSDASFVPVENYPSQMGVMPGEVGKLDEVRFIESTYAKVFTGAGSGAIDVYATLIFGAEAFGVSRLSGHAMEIIDKPLGSAGTADPLNQRASHGWKSWFVTKILNDSFMLRVEHAVSS